MFPSLEEKDLMKAAQSCKRLQIADQNRHEAAERRDPNLSYDDPETEEYQEFMSFPATRVVLYSILAAIVIVSLFFYLTK